MADPAHTRQVLALVAEERAVQEATWGEQSYPDGTGEQFLVEARRRRESCQRAMGEGTGTWTHVFLEEVYEALAETDPEAIGRELIQVAAVACAWKEALDRRQYDDHEPDPDDTDRCLTCDPDGQTHGTWHDDRCARWCETGKPGHACWSCLQEGAA